MERNSSNHVKQASLSLNIDKSISKELAKSKFSKVRNPVITQRFLSAGTNLADIVYKSNNLSRHVSPKKVL